MSCQQAFSFTLVLFFLCLALYTKYVCDSPFLSLPKSWLQPFYPIVTNVSHHQPHRPTFKTTALTVPQPLPPPFSLCMCVLCVCEREIGGFMQHTAAKEAVETFTASHRKEARELDTSWHC